MNQRPRIAITMGDPAGVGPEICLKVAASDRIVDLCVPLIFGDAGTLQRVALQLELPLPSQIFQGSETAAWSNATSPAVVNLPAVGTEDVVPGSVSAACGLASYKYLDAAITAALAKQVDAITTAPINKESVNAAGIKFPGHTELLAEKTGTDDYCMLQFSDAISCCFVTTHVGYADVTKLLTQRRILEVIELGGQALRRLRGRDPRIVVCGLNPHAGEHGLFGNREEERLIVPAMEQARSRGWQVVGPLPPDTAFLPDQREQTDLFVCMYHDQGHIPLKALAFDVAVNVTLGLPIIRTSVDHGTAFDIAWQGRASTSSMEHALRLAAKMATQK